MTVALSIADKGYPSDITLSAFYLSIISVTAGAVVKLAVARKAVNTVIL